MSNSFSQNHRATFQAKFIIKGRSHYSERKESIETSKNAVQYHKEQPPPWPAVTLGFQPSLEFGGVGRGFLCSNSDSVLCCLCFTSSDGLFQFSLHYFAQGHSAHSLSVLKMFSADAVKQWIISLITTDIINSLSCCKLRAFARCSFFCPVFVQCLRQE